MHVDSVDDSNDVASELEKPVSHDLPDVAYWPVHWSLESI